MNLSLQDPFAVAQEYPETLTNTLSTGHSVVIQFNKKGDYLASGLVDGSIVIYDLSSGGGIVAHLKKKSHIRPVTSLSWSSCGRYLLSTSQDWTCKLWDLSRANTECALMQNIRLDGPIWMGGLNPNNHLEFVVSIFEDDPLYIRLQSDVESNDSPFSISLSKLNTKSLDEQLEDKKNDHSKISDKHLTLVTVFHNQWIFAGTSKGFLNIIDSSTLQTVRSMKIANGNIKNIIISPNGKKLAINASDRIIRQFSIPSTDSPAVWELEIEQRYQDVINRLQWNSVAFNHNGEYLVASTYGQSSQDLYIWETSMGSLIKILEGSNEELIDVKWNSPKCMIGSTGIDSGYVYLWSVQFPQKWSALAPDFVEIEENIEYVEKEDEFDILDVKEIQQRLDQVEDLEVDIITKENTDARGFGIFDQSFVIPVKYC